MKSLSLDSPESTELHGRGRRYPPSTSGYHHGGSGGQLEHSTPPSNNSRLHCELILCFLKLFNYFQIHSAAPSSPSTQRKLLYAGRGLKSGSVDLPDEVEKSLSSASTSPCPSPVRQLQVPARSFFTSKRKLYNFKEILKLHFFLHAIASIITLKLHSKR